MVNRVGRLTVPLVPFACPAVENGHLIGVLLQQARLEVIGEELVIAIPPALVVERHDEQVAAFEGLQHRLAALLVGHDIA